MKISILIFILLNILVSFRKPEIESNTNPKDKKNSKIYKHFYGKYDLLIAYSVYPIVWEESQSYEILALKDNKYYVINYSPRMKNNCKFTKPRITKKLEIANDDGQYIINQLSNMNFWALSNDSLKNTTKVINEFKYLEIEISGGRNYKFEILTKENFRIIEALEPDDLLKKLPDLKQRQLFIEGRNVFRTVFSKHDAQIND